MTLVRHPVESRTRSIRMSTAGGVCRIVPLELTSACCRDTSALNASHPSSATGVAMAESGGVLAARNKDRMAAAAVGHRETLKLRD